MSKKKKLNSNFKLKNKQYLAFSQQLCFQSITLLVSGTCEFKTTHIKDTKQNLNCFWKKTKISFININFTILLLNFPHKYQLFNGNKRVVTQAEFFVGCLTYQVRNEKELSNKTYASLVAIISLSSFPGLDYAADKVVL